MQPDKSRRSTGDWRSGVLTTLDRGAHTPERDGLAPLTLKGPLETLPRERDRVVPELEVDYGQS
jgi:hypothetical protein